MRTILLLVVAALLLASCDSAELPETSAETYLGVVGAKRTYERVTKEFKVGTSQPAIDVPDSLADLIQLPKSLREQGVASVQISIEEVHPADADQYGSEQRSLPIDDYRTIKDFSKSYTLEGEVRNLAKGGGATAWPIDLTEYGGGSTSSQLWLETDQSMEATYAGFDYPNYVWLKKPLRVGASWIREEDHYQDDDGQEKTRRLVARVVGREHVSVPAGDFDAFKVEVKTVWVDDNVAGEPAYEYYAPGIGRVLYEANRVSYSTRFSTDGSPPETRQMRVEEREELIRYEEADR